jgi:hypothetical protein
MLPSNYAIRDAYISKGERCELWTPFSLFFLAPTVDVQISHAAKEVPVPPPFFLPLFPSSSLFPDTGCSPACRPCSISYLLLGRVPRQSSSPAAGFLRLPVGDTSDVEGSEGALSNPESHTFSLPVIGGIGSFLPRHARVRACTLESDAGRSSVSASSSSSTAAQTDACYITLFFHLYAGVRL